MVKVKASNENYYKMVEKEEVCMSVGNSVSLRSVGCNVECLL